MDSRQPYGGLVTQLKRYLEAQSVTKSSSSRDTIERPEIDLGLSDQERDDDFTKYVLALIDKNIGEEIESYIKTSPLLFLRSLTEFIGTLARLDRGNDYTRDLMTPFYKELMEDVSPRLETGGLNSVQIKVIRDAEKRFNKGVASHLGFRSRLPEAAVAQSATELAQRMYAEFTKSAKSQHDRLQLLLALDGLITYSRCELSFDVIDLDFLIYCLDDLKRSTNVGAKGRTESEFESLAKLQSQIELAVAEKLKATLPENLTRNTSSVLLSLGISSGARPESFGRVIVDFFSTTQPHVALDSGWWSALTLAELLDTCKSSSVLREAILESTKKDSWLSNTFSKFTANVSSVQDLGLTFDSYVFFGIPDAQGLMKIWKLVSAKSDLLQEIEMLLAEAPLQELEKTGKASLQKITLEFEEETATLQSEIEKLKEALKHMDSAILRSQEALGGSKAELEAGIAKRFSEAIGRLVRRIEREFGKNSFQSILEKESNSLSRLGIELLLSGSEVEYDPVRHDAVGHNPALGDLVTIVETGLLLANGDTRITILKALVRPSS